MVLLFGARLFFWMLKLLLVQSTEWSWYQKRGHRVCRSWQQRSVWGNCPLSNRKVGYTILLTYPIRKSFWILFIMGPFRRFDCVIAVRCRGLPTNPYTISELQNPWHDIPELYTIRWSPDVVADRQILCCSETTTDKFWGSKILKNAVRLCMVLGWKSKKNQTPREFIIIGWKESRVNIIYIGSIQCFPHSKVTRKQFPTEHLIMLE